MDTQHVHPTENYWRVTYVCVLFAPVCLAHPQLCREVATASGHDCVLSPGGIGERELQALRWTNMAKGVLHATQVGLPEQHH